MAEFKNNPRVDGQNEQNTVKRYVHQPLTIEHYGLHAKIQENGKIIITGIPVKSESGDVEYDEIEVPASFIFKIASGLKMTRSQQEVPIEVAAKV